MSSAPLPARSVMWYGTDPSSTEIARLRSVEGSWELDGVVLVVLPEGPTEVRYTVTMDERWHCRRLRVEMQGHGVGSLELVGDGEGRWRRDGERVRAVDGCIDLDLGITPATNVADPTPPSGDRRDDHDPGGVCGSLS